MASEAREWAPNIRGGGLQKVCRPPRSDVTLRLAYEACAQLGGPKQSMAKAGEGLFKRYIPKDIHEKVHHR